ncbi:hypothetical protein ASD79_10940 [Caulobacter sp. Root655]|uniref:hypothetical protein n=1 Tax=Caulobacter sp. Root655 TaxID=1736578 RepID=UPI0006FE3529|nr:hypothetical protein [Caulobacter sp. Root655]KRA59208.1 hypothetical protein ASD79_10940 [Caulobacter sp. Root655]
MGLGGNAGPPLDDEEPTPNWVAAILGISLEEADWLLVLYRFAPPQALGAGEAGDEPRRIYFCEPP